tara:strand:+ start:347 stop:553 length:207 start_codon:yes stop_codon:yes gene_type:complete
VKVRSKQLTEDSLTQYKYRDEEQTKRINLNDLLDRAKEEKKKVKKTNVLIFSGVLFSALFVVFAITYL